MAKMTTNTLKSPNIYRKIIPKLKKWPKKLKNDENDKKMTYKNYISVTSSSYPGFIYLRASNRIQGKK
jgi:hypothetical protein